MRSIGRHFARKSWFSVFQRNVLCHSIWCHKFDTMRNKKDERFKNCCSWIQMLLPDDKELAFLFSSQSIRGRYLCYYYVLNALDSYNHSPRPNERFFLLHDLYTEHHLNENVFDMKIAYFQKTLNENNHRTILLEKGA